MPTRIMPTKQGQLAAKFRAFSVSNVPCMLPTTKYTNRQPSMLSIVANAATAGTFLLFMTFINGMDIATAMSRGMPRMRLGSLKPRV